MTGPIRNTLDDGTARLIENMPFGDYLNLPGISASALKGKGRISPAHLKAYLDGEMEAEDSGDMRFGRAMHCLILEPQRFARDFPVAKQCWETLASGDNKGNRCKNNGIGYVNDIWYCGTHAKGKKAVFPVDFLTKNESDRMWRLAAELKASPSNEYLARGGYNEAVITWKRFGFQLKTRIDRLHVDPNLITIVDLKKCQVGAADDDAMRKACHERGYFIQAAFNVDAVREIYGEDIPVEWHCLFIEDKPPFGSNMLLADEADIDYGVKSIVTQLTRYRACEKSGRFYSYQNVIDKVHSGILPLWLRKQLNRGS